TENRINGLAFPDVPRSLVVFGLGYGLDRLADIDWLHHVDVWYWGDIDTHGFGILNRLRAGLPHARSFLMDRETLEAHRDLWVTEPADKRYDGEPTRLTEDEYALFSDLRHDRLGERVRLEQERIRCGWLQRWLRDVLPTSGRRCVLCSWRATGERPASSPPDRHRADRGKAHRGKAQGRAVPRA